MSKTVTIKGNKYGLVIYVDDGFEFEEAVEEIVNKFKECEKFYKDAKLGVTFEGKMFAEDEEREIVRQITENTSIRISCIIDNNKIREDIFRKSVEERVQELETNRTETLQRRVYIRDLERRAMDRLGRRVKINQTAKKKTVELTFDNDSDLEEVLCLLCGDNFFKINK